MAYAILRTKKLKSVVGILGSGRHTFREMPTPNSNGAANMHIGGASSAAGLANAVLARLPERRRKGAVLCIEYLITASPEAFARHGGTLADTGSYFDRAMAWLKARHGGANIVCAAIHLDETTPHLVAYVVPLTKNGRLSARDFLGGAAKLRKMQTDFHHWCGKPFGLSRGIKGSRAQHQTVRRYYQALNTDGPQLARADLAAAAAGFTTQRYSEFQLWVSAIVARLALEDGTRESLQARQAALHRQALTLERMRVELDERELNLEKRLDRLAEVDCALSLALLVADFERSRADDLALKLSNVIKKSPSPNMESMTSPAP